MQPINATTGAKVLGWISVSQRLSPEISAMRISWPVTVVPMFAPIMTPTDCVRVMMPEFTRPTQITTVPAEDWMTPVMRVPKITPLSVEEVSFCSTPCILPPASFSRPAPIMDMPYRNSAIPPNREVMCVISITILLKMIFLLILVHLPCPHTGPAWSGRCCGLPLCCAERRTMTALGSIISFFILSQQGLFYKKITFSTHFSVS